MPAFRGNARRLVEFRRDITQLVTHLLHGKRLILQADMAAANFARPAETTARRPIGQKR